MTQENDLVLIYFEDKPLSFARIEGILPDSKPNWYHVKLMLLQIQLQVVTWILRDVYINGEEFTMNGKRMRLEKVECPQEPQIEAEDEKKEDIQAPPENLNGATVISFTDLKRKE